MKSHIGLALAVITIMFAYKVLFEKNNTVQTIVQPQPLVQSPPAQVQPTPPVQVQPRPAPPAHQHNDEFNQFHTHDDFWKGYFDGFNGRLAKDNCNDYLIGYNKGILDKKNRNYYYHRQYCPNGFYLRFPGFQLNIH